MNNTAALRDFFQLYAKRFNDVLKGGSLDLDGTINSFAEKFLESHPGGLSVGNNDETFRKAIPKGYEFYKSIGITEMSIVDNEVQLLDELHSLCRVTWQSSFQRKDASKGSIKFDVLYLVKKLGGEYKIFAYITGDEQKALKDCGLV